MPVCQTLDVVYGPVNNMEVMKEGARCDFVGGTKHNLADGKAPIDDIGRLSVRFLTWVNKYRVF
jgi:hypothetical protein